MSQAESSQVPVQTEKKAVGFVYAMSDPRNPKVPRYIGKTKSVLRKRLGEHIAWASVHVDYPFSIWINKVMDEGCLPVIYLLETAEMERLQERETCWIRFFRPLCLLTNKSDGNGCLGIKTQMKPEVRAAFIAKTIERNKRGWTPQMREKILKKVTGRKMPEHRRLNMISQDWFKRNQQVLREYSNSKKRALICEETGEQFESIASAAKALDCHCNAVKQAADNNWKCRGRHWKYKNEKEGEPNVIS